jgi:hypothetical protein
MLGRSIGYRMAVPAPLIIGHITDPDVMAAGLARRSLDAVWSYFIRHGAVRGGNVTQGYHGPDPRILDMYSGPASCLWSLRSLVVAFCLPESSSFWQGHAGLLPVEERDYEIKINATGWIIRGRRNGSVIEIELPRPGHEKEWPLREAGRLRRFLEVVSGIPLRPGNHKAKYERRTYSSARPLSG